MKRRNIVRLVSFLSATIVALLGVVITINLRNDNLKLEIENNYSRNLNEFTTSVNNISLLLKKARYTTDAAGLSRMAAEILSEAQISKSALSQLPSSSSLDNLNRFLSQAGNYAFAISTKLHKGEAMPTDFEKNIVNLSNTADKISKIVNTVQINYDNSDYWIKEIEQKIDMEMEDSLTVSLEKLEGELTDYPTLVYDGPYSDHLLEKESVMLKGVPMVTVDEARNNAAKFFSLEAYELKFLSEDKGKIESYRFGNDGVNVAVSKAGGQIVYMRKNRQVEKHNFSYEQALDKAKRFLRDNELGDMVETYYFMDEGICVMNFAFLDGETICYTDLIKVGVALDDGEIMFYEAGGYLSNHKSRAFPSAVYTAKQAEQKVSGQLKVTKTAVALIPTNSTEEKRCYEFTCTDGETDVLVYINVLTLEQEEILILLKNDGGILAK